ncbi:hypothetical protein FKM82_027350 [Ascaphus truei]
MGGWQTSWHSAIHSVATPQFRVISAAGICHGGQYCFIATQQTKNGHLLPQKNAALLGKQHMEHGGRRVGSRGQGLGATDVLPPPNVPSAAVNKQRWILPRHEKLRCQARVCPP